MKSSGFSRLTHCAGTKIIIATHPCQLCHGFHTGRRCPCLSCSRRSGFQEWWQTWRPRPFIGSGGSQGSPLRRVQPSLSAGRGSTSAGGAQGALEVQEQFFNNLSGAHNIFKTKLWTRTFLKSESVLRWCGWLFYTYCQFLIRPVWRKISTSMK